MSAEIPHSLLHDIRFIMKFNFFMTTSFFKRYEIYGKIQFLYNGTWEKEKREGAPTHFI